MDVDLFAIGVEEIGVKTAREVDEIVAGMPGKRRYFVGDFF